MSRHDPQPVFQLKVTLQHSQPQIWRRIHVPADIRLSELHAILQIVMGWDDAHMHAFRSGSTEYGLPDPQFPDGMRDEHKVRLERVAGAGDTVWYEYDFGDGWLHAVHVEQALPGDTPHPRCVGGESGAPPEDCGGISGYAALLETIDDPSHPDHEDMLEWAGDDFDPEAFDLEAVKSGIGAGGVRTHHLGHTDR